MKNKVIAALLAFFAGGFGVHRFYLGQSGLGVLYLCFFWTMIPFFVSFIDAILFLVMDDRNFDRKYNLQYLNDEDFRRYDTDFERRRERQYGQPKHRVNDYRRNPPQYKRTSNPSPSRRKTKRVVPNPYRDSGIEKFKDYDFLGAIEDFEKALQVNDKDLTIHFNLACAYSITEQEKEAFYHLDQAVALGFNDFERIQKHDALAFLRIQDEFDAFKSNGYRLSENLVIEEEEPAGDFNPDLLEQLNKLQILRERGVLTEEEFQIQKGRLLR